MRPKDILTKAMYWELFEYSEWLDSAGLIVSERDSDDDRSHDQLVSDFMDSR